MAACNPNDPTDVRRESLAALARTYGKLACETHERAEAITDPGLKAPLEDYASVLFALAYAADCAAGGDLEPCDELAGLNAAWLGQQRYAQLGGATLLDAVLPNPERN